MNGASTRALGGLAGSQSAPDRPQGFVGQGLASPGQFRRSGLHRLAAVLQVVLEVSAQFIVRKGGDPGLEGAGHRSTRSKMSPGPGDSGL